MKSKKGLWGFLFVGVLGVLFHFAYDFLGENRIAGLFFPVNESIWEHLKLLFFPVALWWILEWFIWEKTPNFFPTRMKALLCALTAIPVLYYTYSGIVGQRFAAVDIGIYFVSAALYFYLVSRFSRKNKEAGEGDTLLALSAFLILLFAFWLFSFFPPDLGIFWAP
jgi:hypothetical protein